MRWARIVAALGVLLICAAFAIGTEVRPSAQRGDEIIRCPATIPSSWLVAQEGSSSGPTRPASAGERRTQAACGPHEAVVHGVVIGFLVVGALGLVVGWTALREHEAEAPVSPVTV